jgi:hypothetical protein
MAGRGPRRRSITVLLVLVGSAVILAAVGDTRAAAAAEWTGGETLTPVSVGPNLARCGALPRFIEARLAGAGVDTEGGPYSVVASGCLDTRENVIFDLRARDTYTRSDQVRSTKGKESHAVVHGRAPQAS